MLKVERELIWIFFEKFGKKLSISVAYKRELTAAVLFRLIE